MEAEFFKTTSVNDFQIQPTGPPPPGYPSQIVEDSYSKTPFLSDYAARKHAFIAHCLQNPGNSSLKGYYFELLRISENSGVIWEGLLQGALNYIDSRKDCSDFLLLGIVRLCFQLHDRPLLNPTLLQHAHTTLLNFKYWPDEPGIDSMCYWTENHYIMFSANEYLAGQLFPDSIFPNSGMTGIEKKAKARPRILKWLELRFYTGFNEWLSNIYFDEDLTALLNLIDFCDDPLIQRRATLITNLLLFDMVLNSFYGQFVSTHGRCYTAEKQNALIESTIDTAKLVFGMGKFAQKDNMSAVCLALSPYYSPPPVLFAIGSDFARTEMINQQRVGILIESADQWSLGYRSVEDGMQLLTFEAYVHPKTVNLMVKMLNAFHWWSNQFFKEFAPFKAVLQIGRYFGLNKLITWYFRKDLTRNARVENNIYTYRTPDYLLSSSQDYRKGFGGDQQHIWQATLGPQAVCFTTHPGGYGKTSPEGYWLGSGYLPRVGQVENVLIAIYRTPRRGGILLQRVLPFTHAWLPKLKFDEVIEQEGWIFARFGDGYLALHSQHEYHWQKEGEFAEQEVITPGRDNIWIIELGNRTQFSTFARFVEQIVRASLIFTRHSVSYHSPSQGELQFGWKGALLKNGSEVPLHRYFRYQNPYCTASFGSDVIEIDESPHKLVLDWKEST